MNKTDLKCISCAHFFTALLERVFLRVGSAETDEQLESVLLKFLCPVLLKLDSGGDGVQKKVILVVFSGILNRAQE